jgi:hypothetical protein
LQPPNWLAGNYCRAKPQNTRTRIARLEQEGENWDIGLLVLLFWKVFLVTFEERVQVRGHDVQFAADVFRLSWFEAADAEVAVQAANHALK